MTDNKMPPQPDERAALLAACWSAWQAAIAAERAKRDAEIVAWRCKERINKEFDSDWKLTEAEPPDGVRVIAKEPLYAAPPAATMRLVEAEWLLSHAVSRETVDEWQQRKFAFLANAAPPACSEQQTATMTAAWKAAEAQALREYERANKSEQQTAELRAEVERLNGMLIDADRGR